MWLYFTVNTINGFNLTTSTGLNNISSINDFFVVGLSPDFNEITYVELTTSSNPVLGTCVNIIKLVMVCYLVSHLDMIQFYF